MDVTATAPQQLIALVDVEDLLDGDLDRRLDEITVPVVPVPVRFVPAADLQAGIDALIAAWTVAAEHGAAVAAHRLGPGAAALLA